MDDVGATLRRGFVEVVLRMAVPSISGMLPVAEGIFDECFHEVEWEILSGASSRSPMKG